MAFWGAYGMIVFSIIAYAMPNLTGRKLYDTATTRMAFWLTTIGMVGMTVAFGVAGVTQVYLERIMGEDFMKTQIEIEPHFFVLILCATVFSTGVVLYIINFFKYGRPTDEALIIE